MSPESRAEVKIRDTNYFSSVQFSHSVVSNSLWPHESQHARPLCPSPSPGVYSKSHPWSRWYHPAISSSVVPFSSCPQSLPASGSFPMSQLFAWGGQSTGVSAVASFLPKKPQGWSPLEWTGWISLQSKGIPDRLTCLLRNLYAAQEVTVRTGHGTTDWFQIGKGVRQGCILSPCLFNLYAEYIVRNTGRSTSWNPDYWEKYQSPQICRWHHPDGRKLRRTKDPLDWKRRVKKLA